MTKSVSKLTQPGRWQDRRKIGGTNMSASSAGRPDWTVPSVQLCDFKPRPGRKVANGPPVGHFYHKLAALEPKSRAARADCPPLPLRPPAATLARSTRTHSSIG